MHVFVRGKSKSSVEIGVFGDDFSRVMKWSHVSAPGAQNSRHRRGQGENLLNSYTMKISPLSAWVAPRNLQMLG